MTAVRPPLSRASTLVESRLPKYSTARKFTLLLVFCLAQFIDAFNNSALFSAIPSLIKTLDMTESESTWLISAFQLTFASFLLLSGRISDVYNPKAAFIIGIAGLGFLSIGAGFVHSKILLIILRALCGICGSMTIPSALTLLVNVFPEPTEQSRAIGIFGGCGAVGNVLGLVIGAIIVQYTSWSWVFWFVAIISVPLAGLCIFLVPNAGESKPETKSILDPNSATSKFKSLDIVGVSLLTVSLVLIIFAVTSGTSAGWGSAMVLAPLLIGLLLLAAFLYYETRIPAEKAAVPPSTWFFKNFAVLFAVALLPYFWWVVGFTIWTNLWQSVYGWRAIDAAVHFIPIGVVAFAVSWTGPLSRIVDPKWIILCGQTLMIIATTLLALASSPDAYWPLVFPGFVLGSTGAMLVYTHTNIAIFRTTPSRMAGTVGAIFNGALQLGSAIGIAAATSVEASVEATTTQGFQGYAGRAAAYWFLLGILCVEAIAVLVFYRRVGELEYEDQEATAVPKLEYEDKEASAVTGDKAVLEKEAV